MTRQAPVPFFPDRASAVPLHRQLAENLRSAIRSGELAAGSRVLASRALAEQLGVSRNTVTQALDQLVAEGYLEARVGAGTYVCEGLARERADVAPSGVAIAISQRAREALAADVRDPEGDVRTRAFRPGVPGLDLFPAATWRRILARRLAQPALLDYDDARGYRPLREAIAAYLRQTRGTSRGADHVFVVDGTQGALALIAHVLVDPGDTVLCEDPGYPSARRAFIAAGGRIAPLPVDEDGANVAGIAPARVAYVTPSHQYPTGAVMPVHRRLALLEWARATNATIVEDDYDAEYRYDVETLPSLQALDDDGRVIYVGTLSKVLAPGLRLAYAMVPDALVDAFDAVRSALSRGVALPLQAAAADFVGEGHYALHVRRTTGAYRARRDALVRALERRLGERLTVHGTATGLHLVARFAIDACDDVAIAQLAREAGIIAPALSSYASVARPAPGLVLGFAATQPGEIAAAVDRLASAVDAWHRTAAPIGPR